MHAHHAAYVGAQGVTDARDSVVVGAFVRQERVHLCRALGHHFCVGHWWDVAGVHGEGMPVHGDDIEFSSKIGWNQWWAWIKGVYGWKNELSSPAVRYWMCLLSSVPLNPWIMSAVSRSERKPAYRKLVGWLTDIRRPRRTFLHRIILRMGGETEMLSKVHMQLVKNLTFTRA